MVKYKFHCRNLARFYSGNKMHGGIWNIQCYKLSSRRYAVVENIDMTCIICTYNHLYNIRFLPNVKAMFWQSLFPMGGNAAQITVLIKCSIKNKGFLWLLPWFINIENPNSFINHGKHLLTIAYFNFPLQYHRNTDDTSCTGQIHMTI